MRCKLLAIFALGFGNTDRDLFVQRHAMREITIHSVVTLGGRMAIKRDRAILYAFATVCVSLVLTSCTCKIKEEQQAMINQLRTSDKQLAADIKKAEGDKAKIASELSARQGEVRRCNEKKAFVTEKLNKFPDIWPGWDPNPPAPVEPSVETSTTKKKK